MIEGGSDESEGPIYQAGHLKGCLL